MKPQELPTAVHAQVQQLLQDAEETKSQLLTLHGTDFKSIPDDLSAQLDLIDVLEEILFGGPGDDQENIACPCCGVLHTTSLDHANVDADQCDPSAYQATKEVVLDAHCTVPIFVIYGGDKQKCFGCGEGLPTIAEPEWVLKGV